jgi:hypothetical protein
MAPHLLPKPGEVVHIDFRTPASSAQQLQTRPMKLLQWNIERGYELDKVWTGLQGATASCTDCNTRLPKLVNALILSVIATQACPSALAASKASQHQSATCHNLQSCTARSTCAPDSWA